MPQYIIFAPDHTDDKALERRGAARTDHLAYSSEAIKRGEQLMAAAMLDQDQNMCGSVMIVEFDDQEGLENWLENEAYVTGTVWDIDKIQIIPCSVPPSFLNK